jgi:phenylacetate-CoA ligase
MWRAPSRKNLWELAPPPLRAAAGWALGLVPPAWLLGRRFRQQLDFLDAAQWWPADRSRDYQTAQLRRLCQLAYERTAYYREAFDAAGIDPRGVTLESAARLPTLDRDTLRARLHDMCTVAPGSLTIDRVSTGGTSGMPLHFYINANRSPVEFAYLVAGWQRAGFTLGTPLAVFRGRVVGVDRSGMRHEHDRALRQHFYSSFHLTDEAMAHAIEHIRTLGRCFLHVYPSSAATLAGFLTRSGITPPKNVEGILAESEIVYPGQRQKIESTFGRRLFSLYGLSEKTAAAAECEHSTDYHVWPTYGLVELLDEHGRRISTPGVTGEIVSTGFLNTVVPFIRYRTGDFATYVGERCAGCGREHLVLSEIRGHRVQEMLVAGDGSTIVWTALNMHDDTFDRVVRFQFYQDQPGRALLRLVPGAGFSDADRRRIEQNLARKIEGRLDVSLQLVDAIEVSPRGKAIYVDQRIPRTQH